MKKLAVYFPGIGYTCDKPLLYYARDIAYEKGYEEYINVSYNYQKKTENVKDRIVEIGEELLTLAEAFLEDIPWDEYDDVLFVSKSIGTAIAVSYAERKQIKNIKHILYTPLEHTFSHDICNALAFIGTKDGWSDVSKIIALAKEKNIPLNVYSDCNHSMETENTIVNLEILSEIMKKTADFL